MKIAILNDVHVGRPLMHGNNIRAASDRIAPMFAPFLRDLLERHKPDLLVNLGDMIRSEGRDIDLKRYRHLLADYQSMQLPVIHLAGNHEIKQLFHRDIEAEWRKFGFEQASHGYRSFEDVDVVWLGIEQEEGQSRKLRLPADQLSWLEKILEASTKPLFIFIHVAIDDHDVTGNFFYEAMDQKKKDALFLTNQSDVRKIIRSKQNVTAVFQAHLHYFHAHLLDGIPYITCPAMGDNICAPDRADYIPEIYTIVTVRKDLFVVKVYSQGYCFTGYEQNIQHKSNRAYKRLRLRKQDARRPSFP